ncbi:nuclear body protein SP140-like protein isoform X2 [Meriones unguiculatus]|uniref:nuclear body protein SP140-like protein isoform X2 n=1 Tax=Meriones unguiculatus TaxID=10047 RepID=UPI00293F7728|nr:nuclear body protein SP140-like protein isoform X2 [Meriones unguiculatus]
MRMSTNHENTETFFIKPLFLHFQKQKVAISHAIKKPFPFLEGLRDQNLITNKMYHDFQESFRNLVPVQRVIYGTLEELGKIFDMKVLQELFCKVNMENYPDLEPISKSFNNVLLNALCSQGNDKGDLNPELSLKQGLSNSCSQGSLTWSPMDTYSSDGAAPSTSEKTWSCVMGSPTYMAEDQEPRMGSSQEAVDTRNNITVGESRKRRGGSRAGGQAATRRKRRTPARPAQTRGGSRAGGQAATRRKKRKRTPGRSTKSRVPRISRTEALCFNADQLPVRCGGAEGVLYKKKFMQGISVESIRTADGKWLTPPEFEILGGYEKSKNWRLSVRCYTRTLKFLIEKKFLPNPSRKRGRT